MFSRVYIFKIKFYVKNCDTCLGVVIPVHGWVWKPWELISAVDLTRVDNVELDGGHEGDGGQLVIARAQHTAEEGDEALKAVVYPCHVVG